MMKPLLSVGTVYSILLSDEKQRRVFVRTQFPSNSASFTNAVLNPTPTHNVVVSKPNFPSKVFFKSTRSSGVCKYCQNLVTILTYAISRMVFLQILDLQRIWASKGQLLMLSLNPTQCLVFLLWSVVLMCLNLTVKLPLLCLAFPSTSIPN